MNISDIAKLAGVSRATVSRYFNNGYLSEEKREKIQRVIDETGYVPSASAQSLRTKKSNLIGVIVPKISSETISKIVLGITKKLYENDYRVLLANSDGSLKKEEEYFRVFRNNNVDGIIFVASSFNKSLLAEMNRCKQPIVVVGQKLGGYCSVYHDDFDAAYDMTKLLLGGKPKNIAMLAVDDSDAACGVARKKGFQRALEHAEIAEEKSVIRTCESSVDTAKTVVQKLLKEQPEVEALFCATDTLAAGAVDAIRELGMKIPEDITVAGIGDNALSRVISPKLSTVHYYYEESGEEAVRLLLPLIEVNDARVSQMMMGYEVQERQTTR